MSSVCNTMKLVRNVICVALCVCLTPSPLHAKNKHGVGGGNESVYYWAESSDLGLDGVQSNGTDGNQLVFRDASIDFYEITTKCYLNYDVLDGTPDGIISGTLVLQPKSNRNPYVATLTFWFKAPLDNDDVVTHRLYMEGDFDPSSDWPPSVSAALSFDYWEVAAENRKAQRNDCDDGDGPGIDSPYQVNVIYCGGVCPAIP